MAFERVFNVPGNDNVVLRLRSDGWSGKVIDASSEDQEDREFKLNMDFQISNVPNYGSAWLRTESDNYAYVARKNSGYVCIILEWWGLYDDGGEYVLQSQGFDPDNYYKPIPAWGTDVNENTFIRAGDIYLYHIKRLNLWSHEEEEVNNVSYTVRNANNIIPTWMRYNYIGDGVAHWTTEIDTDLPIFETYQDAMVWIADPTDTSTMLNSEGIDPAEQYKLDQKYYYLHNIFTHDYHGIKSSAWYNYRWKPGYDNKIRLYRVKPSDSRYYTMVLTVPGGLTRFKGPKGEYTDEDAFVIDEDNLQTHFQEYSYTISRVAPRDVVTVSDFDTNIPIFGNAEDATKYANDELSIEDALNYSDILAYEQQLPEPDFGDVDVETETGINGQSYMAGSAIYVLSKTEMIAFFSEIFKIQDPSFINAFKDGNVLFGDNQANAIIGCQYFPFDASLVCSLESSSGSIWVGGWESHNATGKKVNMNDKVITVGEFFLPDMFKDVRDYEPYTNIYVQLPYCGTYQLSVQKYINKTVKIQYAVDIFTGACTALIYANNILLDSMDGMIGSQRPVTGRTAANMLQAITRGSGSVAAGAAGAYKMGGLAASIGGELVGAHLPAFGANVGGGAMFGAAHAVAGGTALSAGAAGIGAAGLAGAGAVAGVDAMYKAKNAYADPPMSSRGQYSGNLGMFANQKVHFIVAIRHNYRPENELDIMGYPSGRGGKIGSFSGFLKSSCVYLADGFIGSVQERNEILEIIAKGIYI